MGHIGDWWHHSATVVDMEETEISRLTVQALQEMELKKREQLYKQPQ